MWYNVYDKYRNFLRKIDEKDEGSLKQGEYLKGVTCFIISKDGKILIEKRSKDRQLNPGEMDLCSGRVDRNEVYIQAVAREVDEEVGISREQYGDKFKSLSGEFSLDFGKRGFLIKVFMLEVPQNAEDIEISMQESEVDSYDWLPMEKVFNLIRESKTRVPYNQNPEEFERIFLELEKTYRRSGEKGIIYK